MGTHGVWSPPLVGNAVPEAHRKNEFTAEYWSKGALGVANCGKTAAAARVEPSSTDIPVGLAIEIEESAFGDELPAVSVFIREGTPASPMTYHLKTEIPSKPGSYIIPFDDGYNGWKQIRATPVTEMQAMTTNNRWTMGPSVAENESKAHSRNFVSRTASGLWGADLSGNSTVSSFSSRLFGDVRSRAFADSVPIQSFPVSKPLPPYRKRSQEEEERFRKSLWLDLDDEVLNEIYFQDTTAEEAALRALMEVQDSIDSGELKEGDLTDLETEILLHAEEAHKSVHHMTWEKLAARFMQKRSDPDHRMVPTIHFDGDPEVENDGDGSAPEGSQLFVYIHGGPQYLISTANEPACDGTKLLRLRVATVYARPDVPSPRKLQSVREATARRQREILAQMRNYPGARLVPPPRVYNATSSIDRANNLEKFPLIVRSPPPAPMRNTQNADFWGWSPPRAATPGIREFASTLASGQIAGLGPACQYLVPYWGWLVVPLDKFMYLSTRYTQHEEPFAAKVATIKWNESVEWTEKTNHQIRWRSARARHRSLERRNDSIFGRNNMKSLDSTSSSDDEMTKIFRRARRLRDDGSDESVLPVAANAKAKVMTFRRRGCTCVEVRSLESSSGLKVVYEVDIPASVLGGGLDANSVHLKMRRTSSGEEFVHTAPSTDGDVIVGSPEMQMCLRMKRFATPWFLGSRNSWDAGAPGCMDEMNRKGVDNMCGSRSDFHPSDRQSFCVPLLPHPTLAAPVTSSFAEGAIVADQMTKVWIASVVTQPSKDDDSLLNVEGMRVVVELPGNWGVRAGYYAMGWNLVSAVPAYVREETEEGDTTFRMMQEIDNDSPPSDADVAVSVRVAAARDCRKSGCHGRGQCRVIRLFANWSEFQCRCQPGFGGPSCEYIADSNDEGLPRPQHVELLTWSNLALLPSLFYVMTFVLMYFVGRTATRRRRRRAEMATASAAKWGIAGATYIGASSKVVHRSSSESLVERRPSVTRWLLMGLTSRRSSLTSNAESVPECVQMSETVDTGGLSRASSEELNKTPTCDDSAETLPSLDASPAVINDKWKRIELKKRKIVETPYRLELMPYQRHLVRHMEDYQFLISLCLVALCITLSGVASMIYHRCDTFAWCVTVDDSAAYRHWTTAHTRPPVGWLDGHPGNVRLWENSSQIKRSGTPIIHDPELYWGGTELVSHYVQTVQLEEPSERRANLRGSVADGSETEAEKAAKIAENDYMLSVRSGYRAVFVFGWLQMLDYSLAMFSQQAVAVLVLQLSFISSLGLLAVTGGFTVFMSLFFAVTSPLMSMCVFPLAWVLMGCRIIWYFLFNSSTWKAALALRKHIAVSMVEAFATSFDDPSVLRPSPFDADQFSDGDPVSSRPTTASSVGLEAVKPVPLAQVPEGQRRIPRHQFAESVLLRLGEGRRESRQEVIARMSADGGSGAWLTYGKLRLRVLWAVGLRSRRAFILGLISVLTGLASFVIGGVFGGYWFWHSLWHITVFCSPPFFMWSIAGSPLKGRRVKPQGASETWNWIAV